MKQIMDMNDDLLRKDSFPKDGTAMSMMNPSAISILSSSSKSTVKLGKEHVNMNE